MKKKPIMSWVILFVFMGILFIPITGCKKSGPSVTDIDGNVYQTVIIGDQVWMAENLKVTRYRNGDPLPNVTDDKAWVSLTTGAYCDYNNDPMYANTYGRLYNWFAVNDYRNVAPEGWHVPTIVEWSKLVDSLGGNKRAGAKLKEKGTMHWESPNVGASNGSGFTALPGGDRNNDGFFENIGFSGGWWTATGNPADFAFGRRIICNSAVAKPNVDDKKCGLSLCCVKDY